jgi:hypothetical protein
MKKDDGTHYGSTYEITHPDLDGPLVMDSNWSPNVTRMFAWKYLLSNVPGFAEADIPPTDLIVTDVTPTNTQATPGK